MIKDKELKKIVTDVVDCLDQFFKPGDKFALNPEFLDDYDPNEEEALKTKIVQYFFEELEFDLESSKPIQEDKEAKIYKTNRENILLGYDGIDWWLKLKDKST